MKNLLLKKIEEKSIKVGVVGLGYVFIMYAGKHNNIIVRILSAPGLWVQRLTTKEPTMDMLEVAIVSTKCALRDQFPEFMEFYNNREWEKKEEDTPVEAADEALAEAEIKADADTVADANENTADAENNTEASENEAV